MNCPKCGENIHESAVICPKCGCSVNLKNKWIAFLLCFFLGVIGAHKFYEHKIGMGILYIFTCGLFGIGVLVDLIRYLLKPTYYEP